jgi:hypothetical protein
MPKSADHLKKHRFKKGAPSPNPLGAKLQDPAKRALRKLTIETYREVIELVLTGNLTELKALAEDPKTPAIQVGVATAFMKAIKNGDYDIIERIAERIVGKIPDELKVTSNNLNANLNSTIDQQKLRAALEQLEQDV